MTKKKKVKITPDGLGIVNAENHPAVKEYSDGEIGLDHEKIAKAIKQGHSVFEVMDGSAFEEKGT